MGTMAAIAPLIDELLKYFSENSFDPKNRFNAQSFKSVIVMKGDGNSGDVHF